MMGEEIAPRAPTRARSAAAAAIPAEQAARLDDGLGQVLRAAQADPAYLELDSEDVHSFVETRLGEIVGDLAGQGHLGRSRNEQAVTALRLWIRGAIDRLTAATADLVTALVEKGLEGRTRSCPASRTRARPSRSRSGTRRAPTPGRSCATGSACSTCGGG
jgi:argininosuccinate lyase